MLRIRRERKKQQESLQGQEKETLNELGVMDVFERRLKEEVWEADDDLKKRERIKQYFKSVLNALEQGDGECKP